MKVKSCFFLGHRDAPDSIYPALLSIVEQHIIEYGVTEFFVGHYGNFDQLAARAVKESKTHHSNISLSLLLPYHPSERRISLPEGFDDTYYPDGMENVPRRFAISRANRYMIDHSDYLISYVWHPASNAREFVQYAERREKKNLIVITKLER